MKGETLADIVAMLRANARGERFDEFSFSSLADRIEAAAGRESNAHINDIHDALYCATGIPGNAAMQRVALVEAYALLAGQSNGGTAFARGCAAACEKARAALAAPARNCDVGTPAEQAERFHRYCRAHWTFFTECSASCPFTSAPDINHCQSGWAQLPFEAAKEGGADANA